MINKTKRKKPNKKGGATIDNKTITDLQRENTELKHHLCEVIKIARGYLRYHNDLSDHIKNLALPTEHQQWIEQSEKNINSVEQMYGC